MLKKKLPPIPSKDKENQKNSKKIQPSQQQLNASYNKNNNNNSNTLNTSQLNTSKNMHSNNNSSFKDHSMDYADTRSAQKQKLNSDEKQLSINDLEGDNNNYKDQDIQEGLKILCGKVILKNDIFTRQFSASMVHFFLMPFLFVSVEVLQPVLLQENYNIKKENQGTQNSSLLLIDVLVKFLLAPQFGFLTDKFGRKKVLLYGIIAPTVALSFMPFTNNIYPQYLLCRMLFASGGICLAIMPFLGDYVNDSTKGTAASVSVIMSAGGGMVAAQAISGILTIDDVNLKFVYIGVAGFFFLFGIFYWSFIKGGNNYYKQEQSQIQQSQDQEQQQKQNQKPDCKSLCELFVKTTKNPWILLGYVANFMVGVDTVLLSTYLIIWAQDHSDPSLDYDESAIQGHILAGVAYTSMFLFSLLYGVLFQRISKFWTMFIMLMLQLIGSILMVFASKAKNPLTMNTMAILGAGMSGLQTASQFLIQKYSKKDSRGFITGIAATFSVIGVTLCVCSGYLVDKIDSSVPFFTSGVLTFLCLIVLGATFIRHKKFYKNWVHQNQDQFQKYSMVNKLNKAQQEDMCYK